MLGSFVPPTFSGRGNVFVAQAIVTAPVIWSTAAGTGGPLLYNPTTSGVTAYLLAMSWGLTTASGVSGAIGITGGVSTAPTTTTAIDSSSGTYLSGGTPSPQCSVYRLGTVSAHGTFFFPTGHVHTGAVTVDTDDDNLVHLGGLFSAAPGYFLSPCASATLTSAVIQIGLMWIEIPNN